jgi:hypothetical protein
MAVDAEPARPGLIHDVLSNTFATKLAKCLVEAGEVTGNRADVSDLALLAGVGDGDIDGVLVDIQTDVGLARLGLGLPPGCSCVPTEQYGSASPDVIHDERRQATSQGSHSV